MAGALAASLATATPSLARNKLSDVPGVVISYEPSPNPLGHLINRIFGRGKFIGSPSIAIMPNGHYVASHCLFRSGGGESP